MVTDYKRQISYHQKLIAKQCTPISRIIPLSTQTEMALDFTSSIKVLPKPHGPQGSADLHSLDSGRHQLTLQNYGYRASALWGVDVYFQTSTGTGMDGQAELTSVTSNILRWFTCL